MEAQFTKSKQVPFSAPVLTYRAKGLASNVQSKVLKVHNTLININITAILAPEMTYTPKNKAHGITVFRIVTNQLPYYIRTLVDSRLY